MTNPRTSEEFNELKDAVLSQMTEFNAAQLYELTTQLIIQKLKVLDVNNISEVEDLYLDVALLTHTASYVAAQEKALRKNIPFDEACGSIGTDDVSDILMQTLNKHSGVDKLLSKFIEIDTIYQPAKEAWAGFHSRMDLMARYFHKNPVAGEVDNSQGQLPLTSGELLLCVYNKNLSALQEKLNIEPQKEESSLFDKARDVSKFITAIAAEHPEHLDIKELRNLTDILICTNGIIDNRQNKQKTIKNCENLSSLVKEMAGNSPKWDAFKNGLLLAILSLVKVIMILFKNEQIISRIDQITEPLIKKSTLIEATVALRSELSELRNKSKEEDLTIEKPPEPKFS